MASRPSGSTIQGNNNKQKTPAETAVGGRVVHEAREREREWPQRGLSLAQVRLRFVVLVRWLLSV
jgi:hypothetical protein